MAQERRPSQQPPPPGQVFSSSRVPLLRQRSTTIGTDRRSLDLPTRFNTDNDAAKPGSSGSGSTDNSGTARRGNQQPGQDIEAQWIEMQNTLGEVELSAASGGANVFSSGHALALEELRKAQIELAKAWARGETDDVDAASDITADKNAAGAGAADVLVTDRAERLKAKSKGTSGLGKTKLEEETENDIQLARQRRAANDQYFEKVSKGVVDVVERLEAVAKKMRATEMKSKEIWGSDDTFEEESVGG